MIDGQNEHIVSKKRKRRKRQKENPFDSFSLEEIALYLSDPKRLTTPESIDSHVRQFCEQLSQNEKPIFVTVQPQHWSRLKYCNKNVEKMIQLHGGEMILGYRIWYIKDLYIEAERHAIWQGPEGEVLDITFLQDEEKKILFVPIPNLDTVVSDPSMKPRVALHPKVEMFIKKQVRYEKSIPHIFDDTWERWEQSISYIEWQMSNQRR